MRFDTSQQMRLGQQMKLAPRMIQSMEILQMPLAELEERIEQELENNITLEIVEQRPDEASLDEQRKESEREASENERELALDSGDGATDFERLDSYEEDHPDAAQNEYSAAGVERFSDYEPAVRPRAADGERDSKMEAMANAPARSMSLADQLLEQWALVDVREELREPGRMIISFLDDDGFLRTDLKTIIDRAPGAKRPELDALEDALAAVQLLLDPPGVGARDIRECLVLQIDALEDELATRDEELDERWRHARMLVEDYLDDLAQNRLPRIAERSGLEMEQIRASIGRLRRLSLAPARRLVDEAPAPITPDAIVEYDEEHDRYVAFLNDSSLPNLQINRDYAEMVRDRGVPKQDREFLRKNLSNAQWLMDAVQQRRHTLQRVLNVVVDAQRDVFDYGLGALKPLPMTQVAEQLGIHVATVSRAVADKHLLSPRGVISLRKLFTGGFQTESGEEVSYDAVKAALKEVIENEDKRKPLSDESLVDELKKRGIEIARRTVAKYRGQMDIQSARLRKAF
jgi:RNA polymerase sigma-54 factor